MKGFTGATAPDGNNIAVLTLSNSRGTLATFMDWGATWLSCRVPLPNGSTRETLLHCATFSDHLKQNAYLGATVGRFANRINQGRFVVDGRRLQVQINSDGNTLHGGPVGFDRRRWKIDKRTRQSVTFLLISSHGDQGFPGNLRVSARYTLTEDDAVCVQFEARTDATTPVSLTNHAYFNLAGDQRSIMSHTLQIDANAYLPVDKLGIPSSRVTPVGGTAFDFRQPKPIDQDVGTKDEQLRWGGYDHAFVLNHSNSADNVPAASLWDSPAQLRLDIFTDMPALQVYTGNYLGQEYAAGDRPFASQSGVALETAFLPDAPNRQEEPSCFLRPGGTYASQTRFKFSAHN